jgi:glycerol-3-phosphate dehydrogenase
MDRLKFLNQLDLNLNWDVIIIGGGATGLGTAVDAASRGYKTLLLEQADFCKGTSSKATKLVHGGVRYLAQGNIALVREASIERGLLYKNAPHLFENLNFMIPNYSYFDNLLYTIGLKFYDLLAGSLSLGASKYVSKTNGLLQTNNIKGSGLKGFTKYHDGQFDDSRLAINLAQTAIKHGACVLNYFKVNGLIKENNLVKGVIAQDVFTNNKYSLKANVVINATGVYADDILKLDVGKHTPTIQPSQGVHITVAKQFYPNDTALMIPKTTDGRVLFLIPWHDKVIIGTTDTKVNTFDLEPVALSQEINFILENCKKYLVKAPKPSDVLSVFAGLRPLAASTSNKTKEISRSHKIIVSKSNLITIIGGKWTTYRKMAEDVLNKAISKKMIPPKICKTKQLKIHGFSIPQSHNNPFYFYGSDVKKLKKIEEEQVEFKEKIHPNYPYTKACVILAVRNEMALKVEDVLARRIRLLFLDAKAACESAQIVATVMATELGHDTTWILKEVDEFMLLANKYQIKNLL